MTCCVKAIHAVNAVLWQPGEQIENNRQTNRLTDYYTRGRPRTPRVITRARQRHCLYSKASINKASINYSREKSCVCGKNCGLPGLSGTSQKKKLDFHTRG